MRVENTGQIQLTQELGQWISKYAFDERFNKYVEIGTWNGRGSTCCFYEGGCKRTTPYSLQSYEISKPRVEEARTIWHFADEIQIIHGRVLQDHECPVYDRVQKVFPSLSTEWHKDDIVNFWSCPYVPMNEPEVVLLDGAEYLTYFEFETMKSMDSIRVFLLDDTNVDKCKSIVKSLSEDSSWRKVAGGDDRNGWAVFERV